MADGEVKIHVSADADLKAVEEAEKRLRKLKEEEKKSPSQPTPKPTPKSTPAPKPEPSVKPPPKPEPSIKPPSKPEPAPKPEPSPKAAPEERKGRSMLATEANPRDSAEPTKQRAAAEKVVTQEVKEQKSDLESMRARIKNLYQAADVYESKGMDVAASTARADARRLERDVARSTRDRAAEERRVSREIREQQALRRAGIRNTAQGFITAQNVATSGDTPGAVSSVLTSLALGAANPALLAGAIGAAVATSIAGVWSKERDKDTSQNLRINQRREMDAYRLDRGSGIFGSSGELVSDALSMSEEIAARVAARPDLAEKARQKWHSPSTWEWFGLRKNEGHREQEINEAEIESAEKRKAEAIARAQKKYMAEEGGLEMRSLRGRSQRSLAGSRDAFVAEMGQEWLSKYKESLKASGDTDIAKEMADLTTQNKLRDRQAAAGAGLVDARSGGAELAAAARWATTVFPDVGSEIKSLHATVQAQSNPLVNQAK